MKTCFFFLGFSFFLLWNLSATEEKFFRVELHEKFFSAEYSPEFFERYVALLGKDSVPFADGIAWVLFEVGITGPVRVTYQYGVAVRQVIRDGRYTLGITGEVRGFPASCLLISAGKGEE